MPERITNCFEYTKCPSETLNINIKQAIESETEASLRLRREKSWLEIEIWE